MLDPWIIEQIRRREEEERRRIHQPTAQIPQYPDRDYGEHDRGDSKRDRDKPTDEGGVTIIDYRI